MDVSAMFNLEQNAHGEFISRGVIVIGDVDGPHITIAVGGHITDKEKVANGWCYTAVLNTAEARIEDSNQVRYWPNGRMPVGYESHSLADLPLVIQRLVADQERAKRHDEHQRRAYARNQLGMMGEDKGM